MSKRPFLPAENLALESFYYFKWKIILVNLHSIPNSELWTLLIMEGCLAVDTVNSLQASTDEQDVRLPITARGKLQPWEPILWEKLHSSYTQCVCSVDQHLSRFSYTYKVLEPFERYIC